MLGLGEVRSYEGALACTPFYAYLVEGEWVVAKLSFAAEQRILVRRICQASTKPKSVSNSTEII